MKLSDIATTMVRTIGSADSLDTAICQMEEHHIHHLPVVDDGVVVGMLSDRDLLIAVGWLLEIERCADEGLHDIIGPKRVGEVMSTPAVCLNADATIQEAAAIMGRRKFHAIPVLHRGAMIGIVSRLDIFRACLGSHELIGRYAFLDKPVLRQMHANVMTVGPQDTVFTVARIMKEKNIRHLLVVTEGLVLGVVSDRDLRRACGIEAILDGRAEARGETYFGEHGVTQIMSHPVRTITSGAPIRDAMRCVVEAQVGCLPVMQGDHFVGILTDTDLLNLIANAA